MRTDAAQPQAAAPFLHLPSFRPSDGDDLDRSSLDTGTTVTHDHPQLLFIIRPDKFEC